MYDLYHQTLRQNFSFMGVGFVGKLNQNPNKNTGAELGGTDRISHSLQLLNTRFTVNLGTTQRVNKLSTTCMQPLVIVSQTFHSRTRGYTFYRHVSRDCDLRLDKNTYYSSCCRWIRTRLSQGLIPSINSQTTQSIQSLL